MGLPAMTQTKRLSVLKYNDLGSKRPQFARSIRVKNWFTSGEAQAVKNLIVDEITQQPTDEGKRWLQSAGVKPEDVFIMTDRRGDDISAVMSPSRRRVSSPNFYAGAKVNRILPSADTHIQRTLALLKVAAVIAKERYDQSLLMVRSSCLHDTERQTVSVKSANTQNRSKTGDNNYSIKGECSRSPMAVRPNRRLLVNKPKRRQSSEEKISSVVFQKNDYLHVAKATTASGGQQTALAAQSRMMKASSRLSVVSNQQGHRLLDRSLRISTSTFSDIGRHLVHHRVPERCDDGIESLRASSMSESSFGSSLMSNRSSCRSLNKKLDQSRGSATKPKQISCFQKKALNRKLANVKAYRSKFGARNDGSVRSFQNMKSTTSPRTPKEFLNHKLSDDSSADESSFFKDDDLTDNKFAKIGRMQSDIPKLVFTQID